MDEVKQAGGLRSVYQSAEFVNQKPGYMRTPFVHSWNMSDDVAVYIAAKKALFRMCPKPDKKRDQDIFVQMLEELFLDTQQDMKDKLFAEWKRQ
jgi:hypothetical protein